VNYGARQIQPQQKAALQQNIVMNARKLCLIAVDTVLSAKFAFFEKTIIAFCWADVPV
jgi:hypothetical protein